MSSKNNRKTKKNARDYAAKLTAEREKKAEEKRKRKAEKKAATSGGVTKPKKKTRVEKYKIKKGVTIRGIKIVDADTKKKALRKLRAEQAARMAVDSDDEWEEMQ